MTNRFRAIREKPSHRLASDQYKIVFENNHNYVIARIRYECTPEGPKGAGWNIRCSDCDEDLERIVRAKFYQHGRDFPLWRALRLFKEGFDVFGDDIAA